MSRLLVKSAPGSGRVAHITPHSAGWTYVGFDLYRLAPGETAQADTGEREVCLVLVTGKAALSAAGQGRSARSADACRRSTASHGRSTCPRASAGRCRPKRPSNLPSAPRRASPAASLRE